MIPIIPAAATVEAPFAHAGELAALTTALCWTFTSLSFTAAGKCIGSLCVNLIRLVLGFLFFVIYCWITRGLPFPVDATPKIWFWLSLSAIFGFVIGDLCLFRAFLVIGTRLSMLLSMALWPPIAVVFSIIVFGEWLSAMQWVGIALTIGGVAWVVMERKTGGEGEPKKIPLSGILLGIGGAFGQAIGYVMIRAGMQDTGYDSFAAAQIRALAGIVGFSVIFIFIGWWGRVREAVKNPVGMGFTGIGAFFGPFLGVSFSVVAQNYTKLGVAATIISITPLLVIPFAIWLQKEKVSPRAIFGAILAIAGVAILFLNPDVVSGW